MESMQEALKKKKKKKQNALKTECIKSRKEASCVDKACQSRFSVSAHRLMRKKPMTFIEK